MEPEPINFEWFYFIGIKKLGLAFKQVGRLTLKLFNRLYQCYKDDFDMEMRMKHANMTYEEVRIKANKSEEWL